MITAYAIAARVFQNTAYADVAKQAVEFINTRLMDKEGRLLVRYRDKEAAFYGHIDDYAFYSMALLSLYEATFDARYLRQSCELADQMVELFWDEKYSGFFLNARDSEKLLYRPKEVYDGAVPSGNSVAGYVLQRLANLTANKRYIEMANKQLRFLAGQVQDYPTGHCFSLIAFLGALYPSKQIVCVAAGNPSSGANNREESDLENHTELSDYLAEHFEPNTVALLKSEENLDALLEVADYVEDYRMINDKTTYYVCENHNCLAPTNELSF